MPEQMILKPAVKQGDNNALKKVQLEHVIVEIQGGKETDQGSTVKVNALSDSGAEIPVISEELLLLLHLVYLLRPLVLSSCLQLILD